ncbi:MAG: DUF255 domain-containing protein [Actinomycetales bacterium]
MRSCWHRRRPDCACETGRDGRAPMGGTPASGQACPMPNRLANATSPYLRQHQDNPVDWRPWSDDAWTEARSSKRVREAAGEAGVLRIGPVRAVSPLDAVSRSSCISLVYHSG